MQRSPLDTSQLRILHVLLQERSVSRAAERMEMTQPAVSLALRQLRERIGDPLLVRTRTGMALTERAVGLLDPVRIALAAVDSVVARAEAFDPATTKRTFSIGAPDYFEAFFVPKLISRLRRLAPQARVNIRALSLDSDFERMLEDGDLDVAIGNWPNPPEPLRLGPLFNDEVVCMLGQGHPLATTGIDADAYFACAHLAPTRAASASRGAIDEHLRRLGRRRDIRVTVSYFNLAPYVLMENDLVFTTGRRFASHYARLLPLAVVPAPLEFPPLRFYQLWHERTNESAACRWLRQQIVDEANV